MVNQVLEIEEGSRKWELFSVSVYERKHLDLIVRVAFSLPRIIRHWELDEIRCVTHGSISDTGGIHT